MMHRVSDKLFARLVLENRRTGGMALGRFLRINARRYVLLLGVGIGGTAALASQEAWFGSALLAGVGLGALARDVGFFLATRRTWPFYERVLDWAEVERIANEGQDD